MSKFIDKRLTYFFQTVQSGGIRAAADVLNVSPSVISRQIANLERQLGIVVLEKHTKGAVVTEAGKEVLIVYQELLNQELSLGERILALKGMEAGSITISTGAGYLNHLSKVVAGFSAKYPNINIKIDVGGSGEIVRRILENEIQIGIAYNPVAHKNICSYFQIQHKLCVFLSPNHPLAKNQDIRLCDLQQCRLALTDTTYGIRQLVEYSQNLGRVLLNPTMICNDMNLLKDYAREGGITLLPEFMYYPEDKGSLTTKSLVCHDFNAAQSHIIFRRGKLLPITAMRLIDELVLMLKNM